VDSDRRDRGDVERDEASGERDDRYEGDRPKLTRRDTWRLIFATYRVSFPYLFVFVLGMLIATWLVTTVLFR
jgi:hypothetical protein